MRLQSEVETGRINETNASIRGHDTEKRPQDSHTDGTGLRCETMEHGGEYPDTMPQAIKLVDAERRSRIYVPISQDGKVVDSQGYALDLGDE
jgi:hypothetical protein